MMTTPERLKRRQLIVGFALIVLAVFTLLSSAYFQHQDSVQRRDFAQEAASQRACIARQVRGLTNSLTARGNLTQRDSNSTTKVIRQIAKAKSQDQVRRALDEFLAMQKSIDLQRRQHPVPPFPTGACT